MTLGLQLEDEDILRATAIRPEPQTENYNIPKHTPGTIHPTPEYNSFDRLEKVGFSDLEGRVPYNYGVPEHYGILDNSFGLLLIILIIIWVVPARWLEQNKNKEECTEKIQKINKKWDKLSFVIAVIPALTICYGMAPFVLKGLFTNVFFIWIICKLCKLILKPLKKLVALVGLHKKQILATLFLLKTKIIKKLRSLPHSNYHILGYIVSGNLLFIIICEWFYWFGYGYYEVLRWGVSCFAFWSAYRIPQKQNNIWFLIFMAIGILFNPIIKIALDKDVWQIIDLITFIIFCVYGLKHRK